MNEPEQDDRDIRRHITADPLRRQPHPDHGQDRLGHNIDRLEEQALLIMRQPGQNSPDHQDQVKRRKNKINNKDHDDELLAQFL